MVNKIIVSESVLESDMSKLNKKVVIMPRKVFDEINEKAYWTYVLGYDFLHNLIRNSETPQCDVSYDFCCMIADEFLKSDEYKNTNYSGYVMLEKWLKANESCIKKQCDDFLGIKNKKEIKQKDKER